jgi:hypothetical protein
LLSCILMLYFLHVNINKTWGTCKVRNEIETKRNETEQNETKSNETKRNQSKRNETKRNEFFSKRNVTKKK